MVFFLNLVGVVWVVALVHVCCEGWVCLSVVRGWNREAHLGLGCCGFVVCDRSFRVC
ncbi:hypothetical protein M758_9G139800 [Ceratodon purpureus]|nr:hypothetical protein M758_9G139800 [Ceratodon purpureus]